MTGNKSFIYKDKKGQQWFLGIYSNNFEDREKETFSWKSHEAYAQWVKDTGVKLPVTIAHQPKYPMEVHLAQFIGLASGVFTAQEFSDNYLKMYQPFAFAQTEAIIPVNGFMLLVAKILKGKENTVKLLSKSDWGMSHGYLAFDRDESTIEGYRSFEFTSLPLALAANSVTVSAIGDITEMDDKGFSEEDRNTLKTLLDADPDEIEQATLAAQGVLQKVLASKEMPETEETPQPYDEIREKIFADLGIEQLSKAFNDITTMLQEVTQRLDNMDRRVKETEQTEDEKIAKSFEQPSWLQTKQAEEDDEVDIEALKEFALGEKPIDGVKTHGKSDNPLMMGWMEPMGFNK